MIRIVKQIISIIALFLFWCRALFPTGVESPGQVCACHGCSDVWLFVRDFVVLLLCQKSSQLVGNPESFGLTVGVRFPLARNVKGGTMVD